MCACLSELSTKLLWVLQMRVHGSFPNEPWVVAFESSITEKQLAFGKLCFIHYYSLKILFEIVNSCGHPVFCSPKVLSENALHLFFFFLKKKGQ